MVYIVRHGQTEKNKAKVLQGRSDVPLNEEGRRQAKLVADWMEREGIRIDTVYTSPLIRAVETAEIIAPGASLQTDDRLIEMDYGPYEGMDLTALTPEVKYFFADFVNHPAPKGMEPLADVTGRLGDLLEEIRQQAKEQNVLLSTHAIAMKGALEYLTPEAKGRYWKTFIGNCSVYVCDSLKDGFTVPYEVFTGQPR